jgi:polyisoprenoid-binding protein YceI
MSDAQVQIPGYVAGNWGIDPMHSEVGFNVRHLMLSKIRGRFTKFGRSFVTAPGPLESSVSATVEMASIDTNNPAREDALRSPRFFDVDQYPQMTYQSTGMRADGAQFVLDGTLTVRDITCSIPLLLEVNGFGSDAYGNQRCGFTATGSLNRSDFGITYNMALRGDRVAIADRIEITIEVEAILRAPGND